LKRDVPRALRLAATKIKSEQHRQSLLTPHIEEDFSGPLIAAINSDP
jgi:hypothetical protein